MLRRTPTILTLAVLAVLTATGACRDLPFEPEDPATVTYAPALGIDLGAYTRDTSGVYYRDLAVGSGGTPIEATSTITVRYQGWLADGRLFDSNINATQSTIRPISDFIAGWQSGLAGMRAGGRRRLLIPPSRAYGNTSTPIIPAGSVLVFEIDIESVTTPPPPTTSTP